MSWWWPFKKRVKPASKWTPEQQAWLDDFRKPTNRSLDCDNFVPSKTMVPYGEDLLKHYDHKIPPPCGKLTILNRQDSDPHYCQPRTIEESVSGSIYFIVESENNCSPRFMVVGPTETVLETDDREWAELIKERLNSAFDLGVIKGGWRRGKENDEWDGDTALVDGAWFLFYDGQGGSYSGRTNDPLVASNRVRRFSSYPYGIGSCVVVNDERMEIFGPQHDMWIMPSSQDS